MHKFLARTPWGTPQLIAALMLLVFLGQCCWIISRLSANNISQTEVLRVQEGVAQWHRHGIAGTMTSPDFLERVRLRGEATDPQRSPFWYLIESAPVALFGPAPGSLSWIWLTRAPYVIIGALLGASLWYVSRRLYGNIGGYIALALYCFSPTVLRASTLWFSPPELAGAWGTFGAVFTAIAVSHTLYAPREVVLWNWRRILLLATSLAVAVGSHFSLVIILPLILAFMLYVAAERIPAALAILGASCGIALLVLFGAYFFHPSIFWASVRHAHPFSLSASSLVVWLTYREMYYEIASSGPALVVLIPASLATFAVWRRTRYFGNIAPLVVAALFLVLRALSPHESQAIFALVAVVFLFVFVAGIAADILESKVREPAMGVIVGLVSANALWNLIRLAQIGR